MWTFSFVVIKNDYITLFMFVCCFKTSNDKLTNQYAVMTKWQTTYYLQNRKNVSMKRLRNLLSKFYVKRETRETKIDGHSFLCTYKWHAIKIDIKITRLLIIQIKFFQLEI